MNEYLIMCRSLSNAQRCRTALERVLIGASVIKAPRKLTASGCGYAVKIYGKPDEAISILRVRGLLTGKIYSIDRDGDYTEVSL